MCRIETAVFVEKVHTGEMRKCSNSTNSMFEEQEAKSYTEETGVFANYHISGGDTGMQKRETIDYEIRGTYASLRKSEKKGHI